MTLQPPWQRSELLHKLLAEYLGGRIDAPLFCSNFEQSESLWMRLKTATSGRVLPRRLIAAASGSKRR
jgi:hypothetical protein